MKDIRVINIKQDMPTVDEARKRLIEEINRAKREGVKALKIIHGYGSTGAGGRLKDPLRKSLSLRKKEGKIRMFCAGEKWTVHEAVAREMIDAVPSLSRDPDLENYNEGVTLVVM